MWLTNKKTGTHFNTDWIDEDNDRKEKQIKSSKASAANVVSAKYQFIQKETDIATKREMVNQFTQDTGIPVDVMLQQHCSVDSLGRALDAVANLKKEYENLGVYNITEMPESERPLENGSVAMADMSMYGVLRLNPDIFGQSANEIDKTMQELGNSKFHPKGNLESLIQHEIGHALIYKKMRDDIGTSLTWIFNNSNEMTQYLQLYSLFDTEKLNLSNINVNLYKTVPIYKKYADQLDAFTSKVRNSDYMKKMWGGVPSLSLNGLVDPKFNHGDAISSYALTNFHEMCAEAFADVKTNGDNASYMSKMVFDEFFK